MTGTDNDSGKAEVMKVMESRGTTREEQWVSGAVTCNETGWIF
jgi:hypothetical protein